MAEKKTQMLRVRLSTDEMEQIRCLAAESGCTVSAYARQTLLHPPKTKLKLPSLLQENGGIRSAQLRVRFTETERAWLEERANWLGCGIAELIRQLLFGRADFSPIVLDTSLLNKAYLELHYQGVSLNQLMVHLNTYKGKADTSGVEETLRKLNDQLDRLDAVMDDLERQKKAR